MARAHRQLAPPRNARLPAQHLWRTRLTLDDQDRAALVKALETTMARVDRPREQARERLGNHPHDEQRMTLIVL
jgi:hypothetical protein